MLNPRVRSLARSSAKVTSAATRRAIYGNRGVVARAANKGAKRFLSTPAKPTDAPRATFEVTQQTEPDYRIDLMGYLDMELPALAYEGDASFLAGPTQRTIAMAKKVEDLLKKELDAGGLLDVDVSTPSHVLAFGPGYVDKENEIIVGLQTDAPLKRAIKPWGGLKTVQDALAGYGREMDAQVAKNFGDWVSTHNQGVFDAYTEEMRKARSSHILTGLPDAYGRGRIIGDYRRVALYGIDYLIKSKQEDLKRPTTVLSDSVIEWREEINKQIRALKSVKALGEMYGFDLSKPASSAQEAVQWVYFGYLASVREQDGAAMSLGRVDGFLDTYIERDIAAGKLTEAEAQEIIDQFVLKLRMVKHLRTPAYNDLFAGDPTWVTAVLGGLDSNGNNRVTKTSFRFLQTLYNIGVHPEPNLTVLWDENLPASWKKFCSKVSIDTCSLQFENDTLMRKMYGHDYSVACCVSGMETGKAMQYFGARCNMPKLLLYALNGGKDEVSGVQVGPETEPVPAGKPLEINDVLARFDKYMSWMALLYSQTMNVIHTMHDKHNYEGVQMALHDSDVKRYMAFGVCGISIIADALSAIQHAKVTPQFDERGVITAFDIQGDFPKFGNDDDSVDKFAVDAAQSFSNKLKQMPLRRNAEATLSLLTITSNVVYGKLTGATPDGRPAKEPFAPGANPMHGRDTNGVVSSLASVSKIPYSDCKDGISYTLSMEPSALGRSEEARIDSLSGLLDGHFGNGAQHLNVNVLTTDMLVDAMENPDKYPLLTIRVSGYAVRFNRLTRKQQEEVIRRTCHGKL